MSRRRFLRAALALAVAPATLAAGCTGNAVEQPARYTDNPPAGPQGVGGGRQKAGPAGKGGQNSQSDTP